MFARLSAFVIWSLVAATAMFWILRFAVRPVPAPAHAVAVEKSGVLRGDLARLFGAAPVQVAAAEPMVEAPSRFKLVGVMAPRSEALQDVPGHGLALIAVDGKPAKAYAVGAQLDSDLVLQSVGLRTAAIGPAQGARSVLLELPVLPPATTGVLPPPGSTMAPGAAAPVPPVGAMRSTSPAQAPQPTAAAVPPSVTAPATQPAPVAPVQPSAPADNFRTQ